jgi:hypothetical protein
MIYNNNSCKKSIAIFNILFFVALKNHYLHNDRAKSI